jgi:hypothetical protein
MAGRGPLPVGWWSLIRRQRAGSFRMLSLRKKRDVFEMNSPNLSHITGGHFFGHVMIWAVFRQRA